MGSCIEDGFTTSGDDRLAFSCDTLSFDTVFTDQATPTKQFVVYNRHKKQINISSIKIAGTGAGRFYLNVDGMKGEEFHDVAIRGEDSIYVFVECKIDATGSDAPVRCDDRIEFVTNGVTQSVALSAWAQDVTRLYAPHYTADTRLTAGRPYVVFDTLRVDEGVTLTIDAGVTLCFHDKASMRVDGTLVAAGTRQRPVQLRGDRTDYLFKGANYDIMSGQWGEVTFGPESYGNELRYVLMRGSSAGVRVLAASAERRALYMLNTVLHNSAGCVLTADGAWIDAEGCELSDAASHVVSIGAGRYHFAQCTFANYYLFGFKGDAVLGIRLKDDSGTPYKQEVTIDNSIISGMVDCMTVGDYTGYNVLIRGTMLTADGKDDANFIGCTWGGDAKFFVDRQTYIFDYRLGLESSAIGCGDASLCPASAVTDRYGRTRLSNGRVDAGAYVYSKDDTPATE